MCGAEALPWFSALGLLLLRLAVVPAPAEPVASALRCTLPSPRNVHFVSRNLKNVLHWLPPEGIPEDKLIYSVKYLVYGTARWINDAECRNISQTWCDLSHGTSDHKELYHARVKAFLNGSCSSWTESPRFNPLTDTKIDPPAFALSSAEKSISVIVAAPKTWSRNSRNEPNYLHEIYPTLQYNVSVFNTKKKTQWMFCIKSNRLDVFHLESNTVYCVTVQVYIMPLLFSGLSKDCIATLRDSAFKEAATILLGYILPVLLTVLIILVLCCCVYRYIHITKQKYPTNLVLKYSDKCERGNLFPSEKTVINFITINIAEEQKTSLEDTRLLGSAHSRDGCCDGNSVEGKASEVQLAQQDSQDACLNEEVMFENEQDENKLPMMKLVSQRASGEKHEDEVVVYEFDLRAEDTTLVQEKLSLKAGICALEGLLHKLQKVPPDLITDGTEQAYCPQFGVGAPGICSGEQPRETLLNKMGSGHNGLQVPSQNLVPNKPGQTFCPQCNVVADPCLAHNQKETFFDEKRAALEKPQTFANVVTRSATSKHQTWATQDQEAAKKAKVEDEQNIIIDWDPQTGILNIPLSNLISDEILENEKYEDSLEEGLLSRVYERQCSAELLERDEERYLLHLKEQWGLHIQMQT
ncbi:interleukin-20 receptor subunit alpha isoform X1 [Podarcis lilfordi]|uniref:Interleukin-20 receptor subunit alpha isoform X1 n=1 Tax=Podarcis lilfordi TaxID=74358 RepID=A0AA35K3I3_9SAUR|nr:interleukin-20 receptor subunit alpha isoform X1 [Podarcis lilfordi]